MRQGKNHAIAAKLTFVDKPHKLPEPPVEGRVVLVDLAFALNEGFETVTRPFIEQLGARLAGWIDHHDHEIWQRYQQDPRFVLVGKKQAPACPQLITPELVQRLGKFEHVLAHADFDGCMTAAKLLRGGSAPYPEADEDARAIDYPGHGYRCSARGERLARAMGQAKDQAGKTYVQLLERIAAALVQGEEPADLRTELNSLEQARLAHEKVLLLMLNQAERPHPEILLLRAGRKLASPDRKMLLREMQQRARVGIVSEPGWTTVATYHVDGPDGFDLRRIEGLTGLEGYAYGMVDPEQVIACLVRRLQG